MRIVIDPGHGAPDGGAVGPKGTHEADINLVVARYLAKELTARGHIASMTRSGSYRNIRDDRTADLRSRPALANRVGADCFISLHCNGAPNAAACGFEIFTSPGRDHSDTLATAIFEAWAQVFPQQRKRTDISDGDPDKEANYLVLRESCVPAVLVEMGFISNPQEEIFLRSTENHAKMAASIVNGIEAWERKRRG